MWIGLLYDPQDGLLKTFVNSTREGVASSGLPRILDDIPPRCRAPACIRCGC